MKWIFKLIFTVIINAAILWALEIYVFPDSFKILGGTIGYPVVAFTFAAINTCVKPVIKILTIPLRVITLGLFSLLTNAILLWIVEWIVNFFQFFDTVLTIKGFLTYLLAGIILGTANTIIHYIEN